MIAVSLNETGSTRFSFIEIDNTQFGSAYKYRTPNGENAATTTRPISPYFRMKRDGSLMSTYIRSGVFDSWIPLTVPFSSRTLYMDLLSDDVYLGAFTMTNNTTSNGFEYLWNTFKAWSPIELQASGANSILIINNVGVPIDIKVTV
jgi:hypothetical protein